ncbi:hypothetical protein JCM17478_15220 [Thermopirellula anaerolimosa]
MRTRWVRTIGMVLGGSPAQAKRRPACNAPHAVGSRQTHAKKWLCLAVTIGLWASAPDSPAPAQSWIFQPSYYSHSPQGERVAQFQPENSIASPVAPNYVVSGYRHTRSTIRGAESYDHLHVVRTWGLGEFLRPYEEWEFPFRAGATPYGPWGNPQGPWTLPFDSWRNPFGLGRLPNLPWWLWPRW